MGNEERRPLHKAEGGGQGEQEPRVHLHHRTNGAQAWRDRGCVGSIRVQLCVHWLMPAVVNLQVRVND